MLILARLRDVEEALENVQLYGTGKVETTVDSLAMAAVRTGGIDWIRKGFAGPKVAAFVAALAMAIGMGAWMRFRGHSWRGIAEMSAAMYVPFLVLLVPFWAGAMGEHAMMTWGHVLMLPAMAAVMLLRPDEYAH